MFEHRLQMENSERTSVEEKVEENWHVRSPKYLTSDCTHHAKDKQDVFRLCL